MNRDYSIHGQPAFVFQDWYIGVDMMFGIKRYVCEFILPGGFLEAVISNDLKQAVALADSENIKNIQAFAAFFYQHMPMICHGSIEEMNEYRKATVWHGGDCEKECRTYTDAWTWMEIELEQHPRGLKDAMIEEDWRVEMKYQAVADLMKSRWQW
jgi:hypothetical protein